MNKLKALFGVMVLSALAVYSPAMALTPPQPAPERLPFIRLYNPAINDHFYTSSRAEADTAVANHGYRIEGQMGYVELYQQDGTELIYRLWNPAAAKHFYTTSSVEMQSARASGFVLEGSPGFMLAEPFGEQVAPALWEGRVTVYRLYNSVQRKHFYTTDNTEADMLRSYGYVREGQLGGGLYNAPNS